VKQIIYNIGGRILERFPDAKFVLKRAYRFFRTGYLRKRYPEGAFMTCNGAELFCDFSDENYPWYDGDSEYLEYELEVFSSLFDERPPCVILDIGAHWGFYSAILNRSPFAKKISKVISLEADPVNCDILSKTLAAVDNIPVRQVNAAISDKDGHINLYSGGGTCKQTYRSSNSVLTGVIPAISLDSLVETYLAPGEVLTHVKLDIDGYEPAFFAGGERTLKKFRPIIMMEFWAKGLIESGYDLETYWDMLQRNYFVKEACFSSRRLNPLDPKELSYLIAKTMEGITNIVLVPKPAQIVAN
jgi:FkbM family methyltransferase